MKFQLTFSIESENLSPSPNAPGEGYSKHPTAEMNEILFKSNGQLFSTITDQRHLNLNNEMKQALG